MGDHSVVDFSFKAITWMGSLFVLVPLTVFACIVLYRYHKGSECLYLSFSLAGASATSHVLKIIIARSRPEAENLLISMPPDYSFPSAHTAQITAWGCGLGFILAQGRSRINRFIIWLALGLSAAAVGYSRIYLQVHYVSDVLAGALVGIIWGMGLKRYMIKKAGPP